MSACPIPVDWRVILADEPGYSKSRRGAAEANKPPDEVLYNKWRLRRTAKSQLAHIIEDIIDSSWGRREYSKVDALKEAVSLDCDVRYVQMLLQQGVKYRLIARHPEKRGWYMPLYENFTGEPIPTPWEEQQARRKAMAIAERPTNVEETNEMGTPERSGYCEDERPTWTPDQLGYDCIAPGGPTGPDGEFADSGDTPEFSDAGSGRETHAAWNGDSGRIDEALDSVPDDRSGDALGDKAPSTLDSEIHFGSGKARQGAIRAVVPMHRSEIHFASREIDFAPAESYCAWNWKCPFIPNQLPAPKTFIDVKDLKQARPACFDPGDGLAIQFWLRDEPFGYRAKVTGKAPLTEPQLQRVLASLAKRGWTGEEFVSKMRECGETVSQKPDSIGAMLGYLIKKHLPPRPYPAGERRAEPLGTPKPKPPG